MGNIWALFVGFLENVLLTFFNWFESANIPGSAGLAIILFTVIARLVILPLTLKSLQSTRRMQELQPQIKEIQRKYGKDQAKLSEETMKLYKEYKVNPAGGCLPMLLQFPIFIGVYQAVLNLTQLKVPEHAVGRMIDVLGSNGFEVANLAAQRIGEARLYGGFLWIDQLGKPDPLYILGVLSVVFQLIVQLMATPRVQDPQQKAMTQSMLILPLMFGYLGFTFPAGAVLYWVIGSILSMIQQYVISGWGSLANYLKFLPTTGGLLPPITPPAIAASANAHGGTSTIDEPATEKVGFWDVLRPLTQQGQTTDSAPETDETSGQALNDMRRQFNQNNPRRRRTRRS
ncbi:MAG TPA: YidC/Oxa1 family membrane protein insertase [Roseiflexaceae bacterium]|nr:YidC/Oxa1 family membrane protein insertase [Roseiflexaceae bacterium]